MNESRSKPRLAWKKEEDQALKHLKQDLKIQKWTEISEKLTSLYQISNRNHQQCRDRYVNFLQKTSDKKPWTIQSFQKLIQLYVVYGNKWSEIANHFENMQIFLLSRNGLQIKNKFYSRLRKGIRNVNFLIQTFLNQSWQKFSFDMIFKLINCGASKFDFSQKSPLGRKIQQQITFVQDVFNISWLDKKDLRRAFKSKNMEDFHRENVNKLIQGINFIDENFDKKHSNRRICRQNSQDQEQFPVKSFKTRFEPNSKKKKKVEKQIIESESLEQNQIAHFVKKPKIQIISINSFEKEREAIEANEECHIFGSLVKIQGPLGGNDNKKKIAIRFSGYRQHKPKEIKQQAMSMAQQKFFGGQSLCDPSNLKTHDPHHSHVPLD